jgi:hypothetical protein
MSRWTYGLRPNLLFSVCQVFPLPAGFLDGWAYPSIPHSIAKSTFRFDQAGGVVTTELKKDAP